MWKRIEGSNPSPSAKVDQHTSMTYVDLNTPTRDNNGATRDSDSHYRPHQVSTPQAFLGSNLSPSADA
jgi:hypothetical protein